MKRLLQNCFQTLKNEMVMLPRLAFDIRRFLKRLNVLKSLETLVVYNDFTETFHNDRIRLHKEPFLSRIKHILIPCSEWLNNIANTLNLETLGVHNVPTDISVVLFKNIQNFIFLDESTAQMFYADTNKFENCLLQLSSVCKDNLRSLKVFNSYFKVIFFCFCLQISHFPKFLSTGLKRSISFIEQF